MRVAILDDYQQVSLASTDWSTVRSLGQIDVFAEHISRTEALVSALEPYDVVVAMRERTPFDADRLGRLPRLRLLVTTGMGNASIDLEAAAARGITVCGTEGIGSSTAELTWGLILALVRHIPEEDQRLKLAGRAGGAALGFGGGWQRTVGTGLEGKRLGVVGLGKLGRRVADVGRAFGLKVVAWSQNLEPDVARKAHVKAVSKEELFSSSDVVTVHYKLSPRSVGLVGAAELALMKPSAYLVNTSRGSLVDSAALLAALRSRAIAGAALDVYDVEPLPLSDPLRSAPNVVLTPHLGYVTAETYQVFYGDAAEDIVAFAEGSPVRVLTASLFLARRLPARVAARQGQGTFARAEKTRQAIMRDADAGCFNAGGSDADDARMIGWAEALLRSVLPERDPLAEQVAALVSHITDDPGLRRFDQLSASSGMTARTLQRLFADYVGVSPKWVMRRARLHEASSGLYYYGDDHGAAAVVVADPFADDAAG
jgi:phosphoglycerate dehydrogenase-like enzyme/AraC-like DNA-binding protein